MYTIKQPNRIIFGKNSAKEFNFPKNCLVITSKGAKSRIINDHNWKECSRWALNEIKNKRSCALIIRRTFHD